jgi:PHS family inorganic phosphate transporter-like MFS transporter
MGSSLWSKLKFLVVTSVGLYSDGYLNITIGLVVPMLGYIYFQDEKSNVPTVPSDAIKGSLSLGMIVGQLLFGVFGDALGRHTVYGKELVVTIFGTLMVILYPGMDCPTAQLSRGFRRSEPSPASVLGAIIQ